MRQCVSPPACISAALLPHTSLGSGQRLQGLLCVRAWGRGQAQAIGPPGQGLGGHWKMCLWSVLRKWKKLHLLIGFWVGLRNSFTPLLFHTTFLIGSALVFIIYLTFLKNFSKVDWIWAAAGPVFQHLYFQLVRQILFQAFHSFDLCNFFFNELAWGTQLFAMFNIQRLNNRIHFEGEVDE